jgi:hypothetical protein
MSNATEGPLNTRPKPVGPVTYTQSSGADVWPNLRFYPFSTNRPPPRPDFADDKPIEPQVQK